MGFSDGVINVILEYTLEKLDGKLIKNYVEKVASSMKRKGVKSTLEAYDYLLGDKKPASNKTNIECESKEVKNEKMMIDSDDFDEISDDDIGNLL